MVIELSKYILIRSNIAELVTYYVMHNHSYTDVIAMDVAKAFDCITIYYCFKKINKNDYWYSVRMPG